MDLDTLKFFVSLGVGGGDGVGHQAGPGPLMSWTCFLSVRLLVFVGVWAIVVVTRMPREHGITSTAVNGEPSRRSGD